MTFAAKWLRSIEIAFWLLGISLLGAASAATLSRWNYQAQQERALFQGGSALSIDVEARADASLLDAGGDTRASVEEKKPVPERRRPPAVDSTALGRIEIPRIGVAAIVKEGGDEKTLSRAVGLIPGSSRPGDIGNVVLAGHRDTFFRGLRNIKVNDRIRVIVPPHTYEYEVQSLRVVTPDETSVLQSRGVEELTLVTCYPFRFVGPAPDRFIVSAARVN